MRRPRGAVLEALVWLAFAGTAFALTYHFDERLPTYKFGATGWPRAVIVGIALAALALLLASFVRPRAGPERAPDPPARSYGSPAVAEPAARSFGEVDWKTNVRRLVTFALPLAYVLAMNRVGFLLVTPLFLAGYMYLLGLRRWVVVAVVALGIYGLVLVLFVKLLFTPLPLGAGVFHTLNARYVDLIR